MLGTIKYIDINARISIIYFIIKCHASKAEGKRGKFWKLKYLFYSIIVNVSLVELKYTYNGELLPFLPGLP